MRGYWIVFILIFFSGKRSVSPCKAEVAVSKRQRKQVAKNGDQTQNEMSEAEKQKQELL